MATPLTVEDGTTALTIEDGTTPLTLEDEGTVVPAVEFTGVGTFTADATIVDFAAVTFTGTGSLYIGGHIQFSGMASFVAAASVIVGNAQVTFTGGATMSAAVPPRGTRRRVVAVGMDGSAEGEFENAELGSVVWTLNRPDEWSFVIPSNDPKAALVHAERFREVQVWRGDLLLTWGPIIRPSQSTDGRLVVSGKDCLWYLGRRSIGKADRTNYVTNGSFEDGLTGWGTGIRSAVEPVAGRDPSFILTTVSTERAVGGRYSARQEQTNPTYPKYGANLYQQFDWTVTASSGDIWTAAVQCYLPSADFDSPQGGSLIISRFSTTEFVSVTSEDGAITTIVAALIGEQTVPITADTPKDRWVRLDVDLLFPLTGATETVVIQLCSPKGVVHWDLASVTYNERLEFLATDQATIAAAIVAHLQGPAFDKTDLNIDTSCPLTGVLRDRTYLYSEHPNGLRSLEDFTRLDDGFDHHVAYTPTTRTYTTEYPAAGRWRPNAGLELGRNLVNYRWAFDGESAATSVVTLGQGSGSDREEGFATDTSGYADGLILEEVLVASPETGIEALDNLAAERLQVTLDPQILEVTTIPIGNTGADRLLGYVRVGDVLPVTIYDGDLALAGERFRVVRMALNPDDTLSFTLNRRDVTA